MLPPMPTAADRRQQAIEVLNILLGDIIVGLKSLELFSQIDARLTSAKKPLSNHMRAALLRLSNLHLLLALAKWIEFYKRYKNIIPSQFQADAKNLCNELEGRGVRHYRNKVAGHIWDDDLGRPLSSDEAYKRLLKIIGPDEDAFNRWIFDPTAADKTNHIVGLTEAIRDALKTTTEMI